MKSAIDPSLPLITWSIRHRLYHEAIVEGKRRIINNSDQQHDKKMLLTELVLISVHPTT